MTESELRTKVVNIALADLGAEQYSMKHKHIIEDFSKIPHMGNWMDTHQPWCAATVSVWGWRAGLTDIFYPSASCNEMIRLYRANGRWEEDDTYRPKKGDIIMYDWDDSGYGDNKGEADHVGLVTKVEGGIITVIEGNRHNAVAYREIAVGARYIRGFCLPDFKSKSTKGKTKPATWAELLQVAMNVSYDLHLTIEPVVSAHMKREIDHHYLWKRPLAPIVNAHVSWLQEGLKALGYDLRVDGSFWTETETALKKFQKRYGLDVDGYAGVQTHTKMIKVLNELKIAPR